MHYYIIQCNNNYIMQSYVCLSMVPYTDQLTYDNMAVCLAYDAL